MRLIDADALKEQSIRRRGLSWDKLLHLFCITGEELDNAPTVSPDMAQVLAYESGKASAERPQGEWKKHGLCFECPECHCGCMFTIVDKIVYGELNFCPNCGAKMKGGAE